MKAQPWWGSEILERAEHDRVWARAGGEVSYGTMREQVRWLAGVLPAYGIGPRSAVALHGAPSFTQLWALFALWSVGAQAVLLEPFLPAAERDALLRVYAPQFVMRIGERYEGERRFVDECEVQVRRLRFGRPARTDHCLVQFSSGSSGRRKAVGRTPGSLLAELRSLRAVPGMPAAGERVAVLDRANRSFGLVGGVLHATAVGATVLLPPCAGPEGTAAAAGGAHVVLGGPRHIEALADAPPRLVLPDLRVAASAGAALDEAAADRFRRRFGVPVGQAYGTTETGVVAADLFGGSGPGSVGTPVPGVRTRVAAGVLYVQAPRSPYPYHRKPWQGHWMSTQDRVERDPATGALRLCGRAERSEERAARPHSRAAGPVSAR